MKLVDHTGSRFGSLLVKERSGSQGAHVMWSCLCDCGETARVRASHLVYGNVRSCGCQKGFTTHGEHKTRLYEAWGNMWGRVRNHPSYIKLGRDVHPDWSDYVTFRDWALDNGYQPGLHLHRIDNGKGYSPDNCEWLTPEAHRKAHSK